MNNDISALRQHLFETLAALKDKENPMDIERAKAVSDVAQVIINTAKVEVEYAKATGHKGSTFLEMAAILPPASTSGAALAINPSAHKRIEAAPGVTQYQVRG